MTTVRHDQHDEEVWHFWEQQARWQRQAAEGLADHAG